MDGFGAAGHAEVVDIDAHVHGPGVSFYLVEALIYIAPFKTHLFKVGSESDLPAHSPDCFRP